MEYERIEKLQAGMISPSKLRMKLMGPHRLRSEEGGFNSNSSRTSPSKLDDSDFTKNSLFASDCSEFKENAATDMETMPAARKNEPKIDNDPKVGGGNLRMSYPVRVMEHENPDYDGNTNSSSFEFHKGERSTVHQFMSSSSRQLSSKWNDAEKWIRNKQQNANSYNWKKTVPQNQSNVAVTRAGMITPEHGNDDNRHPVVPRGYDSQRVDFLPSTGMPGTGKDNKPGDANMQCIDSRDMSCGDSICTRTVNDEPAGYTAVREVWMRDMGTEMTPVASQEPSRTATPVGSATLRSPITSIPSTPRRDESAPTPRVQTTDKELQYPREFCERELTEELKLKTRREIVALGTQLGKMNIAAWASKQETEKNVSGIDAVKMKERERLEFERRAVAWEEAEKTKHTARHKREEIIIQAWEAQLKVKLEAEMRRIEARVDQMRAQAQAKMVQKIEKARQRSEVKRATAEGRKKRDAARIAVRAEYMRQTGRIPVSLHLLWITVLGFHELKLEVLMKRLN